MAKTINTILSEMSNLVFNPAAIQNYMVNLVTDTLDNGTDIVNASNPFVMLLGASALNTASFINRDQRSLRRTYAYAAQTEEELYLHMSDKDYVDRFAVPSRARFLFFLNKAELLNKMVLDSATGIQKVVIPRNSYVNVADTIFSLEYPVEIRVPSHGGIQVLYDAEKVSPTKTLTSNLIEWVVVRTDDGTEMLCFELEMAQFKINEYSINVNASIAVKEKISLTDNYYFCRVFEDQGNGDFTEIRTTHSDTVYDVDVPTAVLKVVDSTLTVKVPQIYVDSGLLNKTLRVFVYETKGVIDIPLKSYRSDSIEKTFWSIFPNEIDQFVSPLSTFNQWIIQASTNTIGGAKAMTIEELAPRVKNNSMGSPVIPITPAQITSSLSRSGYSVVKNIDNISDRIFLATRSMPEPQNSDLITSAASGVGTLPSKIENIVTHDTVVDNGELVTILPGTLYKIESGILSIVDKSEKDTLDDLPVDQRAVVVSRRNYFYTPFYYVLDTSNDEFDVRAYHLDSPSIKERSFVAENDTTGMQVSMGAVSVERMDYGYRVLIRTKSSDNWKALEDDVVNVQLAVAPNGSVDRAYINGTMLGKTDALERIYEFPIHTNMAIDGNHRITVTNFTMYSEDPRDIQMDLDTRCEIFFTTNSPAQPQWVQSDIDAVLGQYLLEEGSYAITHETFRLISGVHLEYLWTRARSTVSEEDYVRWEADVPALYEEDVYETDSQTGAKFQIVNDEVVFNIVAHQGDPILDGGGNPVYKYLKGEVKKDAYGEPIIANPRKLLRQIDLVLIEGVYSFATDASAQTYKQQLTEELVEWLTEELPTMGVNLLENTELMFYPISSIGNVNVIYGPSLETSIEAGQTFEVRYHVRSDVYANVSLKQTIEKKTIRIIGEALKNKKVAVSDITDSLKQACGDDVLSIFFKGLGGDRNLDMVTIVDDARRLSIRKRLVNRSDEVLYLQEAVDVQFIRHTTS